MQVPDPQTHTDTAPLRRRLIRWALGLVCFNIAVAILLIVAPAPQREGAEREGMYEEVAIAPLVDTDSPAEPSGVVDARNESDTGTGLIRTATPPSAVTTGSTGETSDEPATHAFVPIVATGTVLDAMQRYAESSDFSYAGRTYTGLGFFVDEIMGTRAKQGNAWILYVNGEKATRGASGMDVVPGDSVEWRFESTY